MPKNILQEIADHKLQEVTQLKQKFTLKTLQTKADQAPAPRDFIAALKTKLNNQQSAIIAEIKKASPSKGIIRENFDVPTIAKSYANAGAACLSVLTDEKFFQGHNNYLQQAHAVVSLPLLRKDFIIDEYQIYEARSIGADCILLIVALLDDVQLQQFTQLAQALKMAVLVEVHDQAELNRAIKLPTPLIGINNRDLRTFVTDLNTTLTLKKYLPTDRILITESGIHSAEDVALLQKNNINSFLIGETFMRAKEPGKKLREIFS